MDSVLPNAVTIEVVKKKENQEENNTNTWHDADSMHFAGSSCLKNSLLELEHLTIMSHPHLLLYEV